MLMEEYNVLDEEQRGKINLVPAAKSKRLINFIIDQFSYSFFYLFILMGFDLFGVVDISTLEREPMSFDLMENITSMLTAAIFYCLMEGLLGGKSIGKYLTRTRAVHQDGSPLDLDTVLKRSFLRMIPFEPFSFLGDRPGWHDRWSNTMVIDEDLSDSIPSGYV